MASQHGDLFFGTEFLTLLAAIVVTTIFARERLEVTLGFASGFGIDARFQNPSMPIPTYPGSILCWGRTIYKYSDGYVDGGGISGNNWVRNTMARRVFIWNLELVLQWFIAVLGKRCCCFHPRSINLIQPTMQSEDLVCSGIHGGYRRELRSDDQSLLAFLLASRCTELISSNSAFNGTYTRQKITTCWKILMLPEAPYEGSLAEWYIPSLRRDVTNGYVDTFRDNTLEGNLCFEMQVWIFATISRRHEHTSCSRFNLCSFSVRLHFQR